MVNTFFQLPRFPDFAKSIVNPYLKRPMQTICHGDFQCGNHLYGTDKNKGKVIALDFQGVGIGMASAEVAAFTMWTMPPTNFMELTKVYHNALVENGVCD